MITGVTAMSGHWITKNRKYALLDRDNCTCQYCGSIVVKGANLLNGFTPKQVASLDHIIARNNGGDNSNENLITCCMSCNSAKKDTELTVFVKDEEKVYTIISQAQKPCSVSFRKRV